MGVVRHLLGPFAAGVCIASLATPASAQVFDFRIPGGALKPALDAFARQSGRQVIYRLDDVQNARSAGARGQLTTLGALYALLEGSGLTARVDSSGAIAILPAQRQAAAEVDLSGTASAQFNQEIIVTGSRIHR